MDISDQRNFATSNGTAFELSESVALRRIIFFPESNQHGATLFENPSILAIGIRSLVSDARGNNSSVSGSRESSTGPNKTAMDKPDTAVS